MFLCSSAQWAPLTSASITCHQAAAAWAAPTVSLPRTPLTCTERVTHWVAAQHPWRTEHGPSAALAPSGTALTKVGNAVNELCSKNDLPTKKLLETVLSPHSHVGHQVFNTRFNWLFRCVFTLWVTRLLLCTILWSFCGWCKRLWLHP